MFSLPLWWFLLAGLFLLAEMTLPHFGLIFMAGAAALSAGAAALTDATPMSQVLLFVVATLAGLLALRPALVGRLQTKMQLPSPTERLMGQLGHVIQKVDPEGGRVSIHDQDWAARAEQTLEVGTAVRVADADGIILLVRKVETP